ncbi:MAG: SAM-dependent chlorinase/fluorinase [Burkholderiales bacterium]|nr:SAM-dependent chlorinase/fluorinase [Anaerolineae bacterium]
MGRAIALLTDFGTDDIYVGVMKGIMHAICPDATFIDITHAIEPQNIKQAAFALLNSYKYFAPGTVFLVVVDPGVGSQRKMIAVESGEFVFIAPNNGVLSYTTMDMDDQSEEHGIYELDNPHYWLPELYKSMNLTHRYILDVSNTFHGRDVMAPAAALIARGELVSSIGTHNDNDFVILNEDYPQLKDGRIDGEVRHVDRFGNVVTNIHSIWWDWDNADILATYPYNNPQPRRLQINPINVYVNVNGQNIQGIHRTYSEVAQGELLALIDSNGYLEIAVNQGSAAALLNVKVGDPVSVKIGNT